MRDKDRPRVPPEDETSRPPEKAEKPATESVGYIAISFGVSATFLWAFFGTLNSNGKPGAGVHSLVS